MIVEKVEALGKLELVKFYLKDIVEHTERISWWPFDPKAVLVVSGEVVGCIDLTKVDSSDIRLTEEVMEIYLPEPEICYHKVNHKESKVYDITNLSNKGDAEIVDKAYKLAEKKIEEAALEMHIKAQTRSNAKLILKPILESLTEKKVIIKFPEQDAVPESH